MNKQHYLDSFAASALTRPDREHVARRVVPPLLSFAAAQELDVTVSADLRLLWGIKERDGSRFNVGQINDSTFHPNTSLDDTVVVMLERAQGPVACGVLRLRWIEDSLRDALESLSLFYDDLDAVPDGEFCACFAPIADTIRSTHIAIAGGLWADRRESGQRWLTRLLVRLLNLWGLAHWRFSHVLSLSFESLAVNYSYPIYGADGAENGVRFSHFGKIVDSDLVHARRSTFIRNLYDPAYVDPTANLGDVPAGALQAGLALADSRRIARTRPIAIEAAE